MIGVRRIGVSLRVSSIPMGRHFPSFVTKVWERNMDRQLPKKKPTVGVIGVPFSKGQPRGGTEQGPSILRENGIISRIEQLGNKVVDYGDLSLEVVKDDQNWQLVKNPRTVGQANKQVADWVAKITRGREQVALTLGGDHSISIGSMFGHYQSNPDMVVIWVDAHADLNTPLSSGSGNIHGMPLSFVLKEMKRYTPRLPGFEWCQPCISGRDLAYIGLRDVDEAERAYIAKCGIASYSMQEVDRYGVKDLVDRVLKAVDPNGKRPIHLSFDVDVMDPVYAPSTGTPVPGGLTPREMFYIAEEIANTGRLSCLDVVEVNPSLGSEEDCKTTVTSAVDVTAHFFGKRREGNVSPDFKIPLAEGV